MENSNSKFDVVYKWVDTSDLRWKARYKKYNPKIKFDMINASSYDELKYSLRSLEKNLLDQVNNIYIVTQDQIPKWLNLKHPKIHMVSHSEIIPEKYLPTFNSFTITMHTFRIPNLLNKFIEVDDDNIFLNKPPKDFFFKGDRPQNYFERWDIESLNNCLTKHKNNYWENSVYNMNLDFSTELNNNGIYDFIVCYHNPVSYLKDKSEEIYNEYFNLLEKSTFLSKNRAETNYCSEMFYSLIMGFKDYGDVHFSFYGSNNFLYINAKDIISKKFSTLKNITDENIILAVNNSQELDSIYPRHKSNFYLKRFFDNLFPEKSQFEV